VGLEAATPDFFFLVYFGNLKNPFSKVFAGFKRAKACQGNIQILFKKRIEKSQMR